MHVVQIKRIYINCYNYIINYLNIIDFRQALQRMFGFWRKNQQKQFNLNNSYMIIQFLTEDQKIQKDKIISKLTAEYENNFNTIIPYTNSFRCSYRYTLNSNSIKNKILLAEVMALIQASKDQKLAEFYQTYVNKIKLHFKNNKIINAEDVLQLYNQRDINIYTPSDVLQIIYEQKGLIDRIKVKTKQFVKNVPKYFVNILSKVIAILLKMVGLGSINGIVSKFIPLKMIINWVLSALVIFFPMMAPLLIGLSKLVI